MSEQSIFEVLNAVNVNDNVEKKNGLSYLSWAWAWEEVAKRYPEAKPRVLQFENNMPYVYDPNTGYMVFTEVTIDGLTRQMWLPVMDGSNKAMKAEPYTYKTKNGEKTVEAATMFDINKTIMRCLAKNLAMFGLGLYIFAGEDLPQSEKEDEVERMRRLKFIGEMYKSNPVWKLCLDRQQEEEGSAREWTLDKLDKFIAITTKTASRADELGEKHYGESSSEILQETTEEESQVHG